MLCNNCGKEINDSAKFCKYCGQPVESIPTVIQGEKHTITCPMCGKEVNKGNSFCTNCGTKVSEQNIIPTYQEERIDSIIKKPKKKKRGLKIFLILSLLLIVGAGIAVGVYFANQSGFFDKEQTTEDEMDTEKNSNEVDNTTTNEDDAQIQTDQTDNSEVEQMVETIRETYNNIVSSMAAGSYKQIQIVDGMTAYYDDNGLKAIIADKGIANTTYACSYYYEGDQAIFAYYEATDSHRFYLNNNQLIRWRYAVNAMDSQNAVNYDMETTTEYIEWETTLNNHSRDLKLAWEDKVANGVNEYMLPGSDSRYITTADLDTLTKEQVKIARNEIYARHGRKFEDEQLKNYFSQFAWYNPTIEPDDFKDESLLNKYEIANRDFIVQYEKDKGYR